LLRTLDVLPPRLQVALSGRPPVVVDDQRLDPGVQLVLALRERLGAPRTETLPVEQARALTREDAAAARGRLDPVASARDLEVAGAEGPLRARHYAPREAGAPLLLYVHGGGWVVGDLDTHEAPCRALCRHAGVHVLSVEYRLAPEHPFPAPLDDVLAAWSWAAANAGALGADPARVAVGGDSAGGCLSAAVAQAAARGEAPQPAVQLLIYPVTDVSRKRRSYELFGEGYALTSAAMDWYIGHLVPAATDRTDPRCSPVLAEDLTGLAPAIVATAGFDPLRDEGEDYATAMRAAGVPVALRRFDTLIHAFANVGGVSGASRAALLELCGMLRAALALGARVPAATS
jgi:acetyl esterase